MGNHGEEVCTKNRFVLAAAGFALAVGLIACQTTKPAAATPQPTAPVAATNAQPSAQQPAQPVAQQPAQASAPANPGQPSIVASATGFSPSADAPSNTMTLTLGYGRGSSVTSWKVTVTSQGGDVQRTWTGDASSLPDHLVWDGKSDSGSTAPDGTYAAVMNVTYGSTAAQGNATSAPFVLDVTPPSGAITLSSPMFSPIESSDTITLKLDAHSPTAKIDSWTMDIYDPGGNVFRSFSGTAGDSSVTWNGRNQAGQLVQSAEDYPVVASVRDEFGNKGSVRAVVPVDILVEKIATGYRILASRIYFKAFTADYRDVPPDLAAQNLKRLDDLAAKLKKFPGYKIQLVGHAVSIFWNVPAKHAAEERDVLVPLSKARAEAVQAAMVDRGLDAARFSVDGVGSSDQLVPDSDYKDRWENRRVALFLQK